MLAALKALIETLLEAPFNSNIMVPFLIIAIQSLIEPQPLPIRLNNGFFVLAKLKKIRIKTLPILLVSLEITRLDASICLAVKTPAVTALIAYKPYLIIFEVLFVKEDNFILCCFL